MTKRSTRTRIEDIRRVELIEAAHRVFLEHGLPGLTTARICSEARMSPGILAYYFKGKDEVLLGMVRYNNRLLMEDVIARLGKAKTGWDRLAAIVEGNFPQPAFTRNVANAWLSVCAEAGTNPRFARLQQLFHRRMRSNLASALSDLIDATRQRDINLAVAGHIDGLWLRKAVSDDLEREEAVKTVMRTLESRLSDNEIKILRQQRGLAA